MPVEIREIIIKTEITMGEKNVHRKINEKELVVFKRQLLEEVKAFFSKESIKKNIYKR